MAWPRFLRWLFPEPPPKQSPAPSGATVAAVAPPPPEKLLDLLVPPPRATPLDPARGTLPADDDDEDFDDEEPAPEWGPRNAALEAAVAAAPTDPIPRLLYGDWLQAQGSPRGEWLAIHHALDTEREPGKRRALEEKAGELRRAHREDVEGPVSADRLRMQHGFVVHLSQPRTRGLAALLAHPAYLLLRTIATDDVDEVEEALQEAGRTGVSVIDREAYVPPAEAIGPVEVTVTLLTRRGQRYASLHTDDTFGIEEGSHSFLVRVSTESAQWSYGCDGSLCEDSIFDDPVRSEEMPIAAGDRTLTCDLRFGISNDSTATFWFRGEVALPAEDGTLALVVSPCAPLAGPPFDPSPAAERPFTLGPVLVGENYFAGVIPGHGVVEGQLDFHPVEGPVRRLDGLQPPNSHTERCAGGADGTLTVISSPRYDAKADPALKSWLSHVVLPGGKPVMKQWKHLVYAVHPLSQHRVLAVSTDGLHLVDARTGEQVWHKQLGEVDTGGFGEPAYAEHGERLYVWRGGRVDSLSLADGSPAAPFELPIVLAAGKNYGVGVPAFHPGLRRIAWMTCVSSSHCGQPPRAVVGWRDADGQGGEVTLDEQGWAREDRDAFGKVAVLPDGRIVATGETSVWLVEPPAKVAHRLGPVGTYRRPLQLTPHEGRWRLWSCAGPVFLELGG